MSRGLLRRRRTAGRRLIRLRIELETRWHQRPWHTDSHIVRAPAIGGAEAFAELLHRRLREMWGFPDPPEMTMQERFKARFFARSTWMDPEASVSALVFHHPEARYFVIAPGDLETLERRA